jgi:hypothetical protein
MLRSLDRSLVTDVSGQPIVPICESQAFIDCLTIEDFTDKLSRSVRKYQSALRNILEERRSDLRSGGSQQSRRNFGRHCSVQTCCVTNGTPVQCVPGKRPSVKQKVSDPGTAGVKDLWSFTSTPDTSSWRNAYQTRGRFSV